MTKEMRYVDVLARQIGSKIVSELSSIYGFSREEAEEVLKLNKLRVDIVDVGVKKRSGGMVLPFCGEINESCCNGIRLNHGLYTQCVNEISDTSGRYPVCSTCSKQVEKNSNGEPSYGYVRNRLEMGENYRDPKGKSAVNYGNVMEKLKISREDAIKAAGELGWTIPESQFQVKKATRGRPKKDATAVDTASEISEEDLPQAEKKTRGRPKKEKKIVSSNTGDDLIKDLVEKANKEPESNASENEEVEEEDVEQVSAEPIKMTKDGYIVLAVEVEGESPAGTDYLINPKDNTLYHPKTYDNVGIWNPKTKTIDLVESDDDE